MYHARLSYKHSTEILHITKTKTVLDKYLKRLRMSWNFFSENDGHPEPINKYNNKSTPE